MKRTSILALCIYSTSANASGLSTLMNDAIAHSASLRSAQAAYQADIEKEPQGRAGLLPQLSAQQIAYRNGVRVPGESVPGYSTVGMTLFAQSASIQMGRMGDLSARQADRHWRGNNA